MKRQIQLEDRSWSFNPLNKKLEHIHYDYVSKYKNNLKASKEATKNHNSNSVQSLHKEENEEKSHSILVQSQ